MYIIENLTKDHFEPLAELALGLWSDCDIEEEMEYFHSLMSQNIAT